MNPFYILHIFLFYTHSLNLKVEGCTDILLGFGNLVKGNTLFQSIICVFRKAYFQAFLTEKVLEKVLFHCMLYIQNYSIAKRYIQMSSSTDETSTVFRIMAWLSDLVFFG